MSDFNDGGRGEKFSNLVDTMVGQLKSEKKVDIENLKNNKPDEYKRYAELFAEHMNSEKRIKTDHCGISFLGKSLNFREFNEEKSRKIVEEIYQKSQQLRMMLKSRDPVVTVGVGCSVAGDRLFKTMRNMKPKYVIVALR